ncbi:YibE/F family protein [Desulfocucumis palustris]|nr:YibE/F family protein [Desulfocucumis palustris]
MRRILPGLFALLLLCTVILSSPAFCQENPPEDDVPEYSYIRARIIKVVDLKNPEGTGTSGLPEQNQLVTVKLLDAQYKGREMEIIHTLTNHPGYDVKVKPGDQVVLYAEPEGDKLNNVYIEDFARDHKMLYLVFLFIILLLLVGGKQGLKSIFTLTVTVGAVFFGLLPLMFRGYNPIGVTVIISAAVTTFTLLVIGGKSAKTLSAIMGTIGGVLVAGILAFLVGSAAHLTGFSDEEMQMLVYIPQQIDFDYRGILFSGMIIGALGAVMDVGMSIASAVDEIKKANPMMGKTALIRAGMNVGRDIMGTMSNTLILAYTGGAIPLMLVFMAYKMPFVKILNLDLIATEIVRALAGSIGLIVAIPITSIIAGILLEGRKKYPHRQERLHDNDPYQM